MSPLSPLVETGRRLSLSDEFFVQPGKEAACILMQPSRKGRLLSGWSIAQISFGKSYLSERRPIFGRDRHRFARIVPGG